MVALGAEALLTAFGLFIGFVAWNPIANGGSAGFTAWGWAWFWITSFLALYAGGYATVKLAGVEPGAGPLNGLVTWGLTTIATVVFFAWTATGIVSSTASLLGAKMAPATDGMAQTAHGSFFGGAGWELMLLLWIGIAIGALSAWAGGKKAEATGRPTA